MTAASNFDIMVSFNKYEALFKRSYIPAVMKKWDSKKM